MKPTIFFVAYGGAHINAVIPLYNELSKRGHQCSILALTSAYAVARDSGITALQVKDFASLWDSSYVSFGEALAKNHHSYDKGIEIDESIAYLGVSFGNLANIIGEHEAWEQYRRCGLNAFCPKDFAKKVLSVVKPSVVIATTSPRMEKAFLQAAHSFNIPSICLVELFGILEESWLSRPDNGMYTIVSRNDTQARLVAAGRDLDNVLLFGSPLFDYINDNAAIISSKCWRSINNISETEIVVLLIDQPEPAQPLLMQNIYNQLHSICEKHGYRLVVRLHPSCSSLDNYYFHSTTLVSRQNSELPSLIHACDLGIVISSTVGWELLLANKPTICLNISQYSKYVRYGSGDGAVSLSDLNNLETEMTRLLCPSDPRNYELESERLRLLKPGGAANRIADFIENNVL